jgi:signal transduction histidine kinase/CheY-like chemotaxis protein
LPLRRPHVLLALAALLPLVALPAALGVVSLRQQQQAMEREALDSVQRISDLVDRELAAQADVLLALAQSPLLDDERAVDERAFFELAERIRRVQPLWNTVVLSDAAGERLVDVPDQVTIVKGKVVDTASHARAVETRKPVAGEILIGPRGKPAFAIRAPAIRGDKVAYVVSAVIRPDAIRDRLLAGRLPGAWIGAVVDPAGRLAARTSGPDSLIGRPASASVQEANARAAAGLYEGVSLEGVPLVTAYRLSPESHWSVHIGIPREIYRAPLIRSMWLMAASGALSLLLAALFLWLLARDVRQRRREEAMIEQVRRMEALGRMTGGVAHDFNNLLMVILGNLEILRSRVGGGAVAGSDRPLDAIFRAAERGAQLTRELLSFSRGGDAGQVEIVDVNARVRGLLDMMRQLLRGDIAIDLDLADGEHPVAVDPSQFDLALLNVAANARDAMPDGGTLRIATRRTPFPARSGRYGIALSISDTGAGVPDEALPHVFEPFFTTKDVGKGTGLGLSQVYAFARQSGGLAEISSKPGRGTTLTIHFPEAKRDAAAATVSNATPEPRPAPAPAPVAASTPRDIVRPETAAPRGLRLLLVDDNDEVRSVTASYLDTAGFAVTQAKDAQSALTTLETERVDLVLSDIVMPGGMDGVALAREIRRRWKALPILLVSGYSASAADAVQEGFTVLAKPYRMAQLTEAIRAQIRGAADANPRAPMIAP